MTDESDTAVGDEPAAQALLGYMKWFSEERWCAGWLIGLQVEMARLADPAFKWLVEQAGGWWWWPEGASDVSFQTGSLSDLAGLALADENCPLSRDMGQLLLFANAAR